MWAPLFRILSAIRCSIVWPIHLQEFSCLSSTQLYMGSTFGSSYLLGKNFSHWGTSSEIKNTDLNQLQTDSCKWLRGSIKEPGFQVSCFWSSSKETVFFPTRSPCTSTGQNGMEFCVIKAIKINKVNSTELEKYRLLRSSSWGFFQERTGQMFRDATRICS